MATGLLIWLIWPSMRATRMMATIIVLDGLVRPKRPRAGCMTTKGLGTTPATAVLHIFSCLPFRWLGWWVRWSRRDVQIQSPRDPRRDQDCRWPARLRMCSPHPYRAAKLPVCLVGAFRPPLIEDHVERPDRDTYCHAVFKDKLKPPPDHPSFSLACRCCCCETQTNTARVFFCQLSCLPNWLALWLCLTCVVSEQISRGNWRSRSLHLLALVRWQRLA